jgi:CPA1 family monovalent cation:H+ antiporter
MRLFDIIAVLVTLSALFGWFNARFLKLPTAIGLMLIALVMSLTLLMPIPGSDGLEQDVKRMLGSIAFDDAVLHGMLGFLLFAGALHVKVSDLARYKIHDSAPREPGGPPLHSLWSAWAPGCCFTWWGCTCP